MKMSPVLAAMMGYGLGPSLGETRWYDNQPPNPKHVPRADLLEQVLAEAQAKRDRKRKA